MNEILSAAVEEVSSERYKMIDAENKHNAMKKYILFLFFVNFYQLAFAQTTDSTTLRADRRGGVTTPLPYSTQITENQIIIEKKDSTKIDTTKRKTFKNYFSKSTYSPKKAALFSFVLPGAGQIYNKKGAWWKLPLCYSAYGATIYMVVKNQRSYDKFYNIYASYVFDKTYTNPSVSKVTADRNRQAAQKNLAYSWLAVFGAHLYCVSDAFVTAHLNLFDIDDNLNLKITPSSDALGVGLRLTF